MIALGLVFNMLSGGAISMTQGIMLGAGVRARLHAVRRHVVGGVHRLFQTVIIVAGLLYLAWLLAGMAGGAGVVIAHAASAGKFAFWPQPEAKEMLAFLAAFLTAAVGGIPQQDVFQRVTSAKDEKTAVRASILGGTFYFMVAFMPMFLAYSAFLIDARDRETAAGGGGQPVPGDPADADPRAHAALRPGDVLRCAALGDPLDRERRPARADRALHRERAEAACTRTWATASSC